MTLAKLITAYHKKPSVKTALAIQIYAKQHPEVIKLLSCHEDRETVRQAIRKMEACKIEIMICK